MEDKIKIHLSKNVYDVLLKDCEAFEFFKKDGISLNKNAFLVALINNYYQAYQSKENTLLNLLNDSLKDEINDKRVDFISKDIIAKLNKLNVSPNKEKLDCIISLKPTKDSLAALSYIETYLLKDYGMSEYFRNLFTSYANLPQDQREQIIFKQQYETILKAIKKHKKIFFTTLKGGDNNHEAHPYSIVTSKEENHCYLLAKYNDNIKTFRLSRILSVTIINKESEFSEDDIELFNKMIKYGPQFMYEKDEETVIIKLTKRGKNMFKTHYTYRPTPDFIEGDFYTFNCSHNQIFSYFRRFGKEAFIVAPTHLQVDMYRFHKLAMTSYQENSRSDKPMPKKKNHK